MKTAKELVEEAIRFTDELIKRNPVNEDSSNCIVTCMSAMDDYLDNHASTGFTKKQMRDDLGDLFSDRAWKQLLSKKAYWKRVNNQIMLGRFPYYDKDHKKWFFPDGNK